MQIELCWGSVEDYVEKIKQVEETFVWDFLLDMLLVSELTTIEVTILINRFFRP